MSPFFQACGGREAVRIAVGGDAAREFLQPVIIVGSDPRADVVLPAPCADKALAFVLLDGRLFAMPLALHDAVTRNDELCRAGWVGLGDEFQFHGLSVQPLNPKQPHNLHPDYDPLSSEGARDSDLHFEPLPPFRHKNAPRLAVLPRLTLIGRGEPAKFKINFDGIEPIHALLLRITGGPWIVDLTLHGRTLVNDNSVRAARLRGGDRVGLGSVDLIAHVNDGGDAVVPAPGLADSAVGPILQQVAQFQQQTFEQFREMLGSVSAMFGTVLNEHREYVREEFNRRDRVEAVPPPPPPALKAAPKPRPAPAETITPITPPAPGYSAPPPNVELHSWLHDQLGSLEKQQQGRWQRLIDRFRKLPRNG